MLRMKINTADWGAGMYFCKLSALNRPTLTRKVSKQ